MAKPVTEIVEWSAGRAYEQEMRPGIADADGAGRCRLDAMARWLQDIAYADLIDAGFEGRGAWIVRRTRMRVDSFPRFGDELTVRLSGAEPAVRAAAAAMRARMLSTWRLFLRLMVVPDFRLRS